MAERSPTAPTTPRYAYFGHHKCATRSIIAILSAVCDRLSLSLTEYDHPRGFGGDLVRHLRAHPVDVVAYSNARYEYARRLIATEGLRGFHVVRDPRDIVVSAYFSHLYSHPTSAQRGLDDHRDRLRTASRDDGLMMELRRYAHGYAELVGWNYGHPNVLEVKFERLIADQARVLLFILTQLGLVSSDGAGTLTRTECLRLLAPYDFRTLSGGRPPGAEDPRHHYRKGVAGDWRNHFTDAHKRYFKDHYNRALVALGYETGDDW